MILPPFEIHAPSSIEEAIKIAKEVKDEGFDYVSGGTDLLQNYKNRLNVKPHLISLKQIKKLDFIKKNEIGSLATLDSITRNKITKKTFPGLFEACSQIGSVLVRKTGTIGGNLLIDNRCYFYNQTSFWRTSLGSCLKAEADECRVIPQKEYCVATFSSDSAPMLVAVNAKYELQGLDGKRTLDSQDFYVHDGIKRNIKENKEIITRIKLPKNIEKIKTGYEKLRVRDTFDYPLVSVAGALEKDKKGKMKSLRVVLGAVGTYPIINDAETSKFKGEKLSEKIITEISEKIQKKSQPYNNLTLPVSYRKKMIGVLCKRLISRLNEQ